jgi:hypothetical protein
MGGQNACVLKLEAWSTASAESTSTGTSFSRSVTTLVTTSASTLSSKIKPPSIVTYMRPSESSHIARVICWLCKPLCGFPACVRWTTILLCGHRPVRGCSGCDIFGLPVKYLVNSWMEDRCVVLLIPCSLLQVAHRSNHRIGRLDVRVQLKFMIIAN